MPTAALTVGAYRSGPLVPPDSEDRARGTLAALQHLSRLGSGLPIRVIASIATDGPGSVSEIATRLGINTSTLSEYLPAIAQGRYRKGIGVIPPKIPNLVVIELIGDRCTKRVALSEQGAAIARALLGIDDPES